MSETLIDPNPDADEVARRSASAMWSADAASRSLGMVLVQVAPGEARFSMEVRPDMLNGYGICQGGFIATLADTAFAFACNSDGSTTVASGFEIEFLEPANLGDSLTAHAREVARRGRSGLYDVSVRRGDTVIAEFRGRSRTLRRPTQREE